METIIIFATILQTTAISLGMGSSTLAIANFFVAIADGVINPDERKMMGVVYVVLRVAMFLILATFLVLLGVQYFSGSPVLVNLAQLTLITVLFLNATLMTRRIMPSKFGPSIQASTWYTFGILTAISTIGFTSFTYIHFLIGYALVLLLALILVNSLMKFLKKK